MDKDLFYHIKLVNERYEKNDRNGILKEGVDKNYTLILGDVPILFSSPHSVKQFRDGLIKDEDVLTGAIVQHICATYKTFGIIRTCNLCDDPNYYNSGISLAYKKAMISCIQNYGIVYVFDIHGCSSKYGFDIGIGTNIGGNLSCSDEGLQYIINRLSNHFCVAIDSIFKASKKENVSNYVHQKTGITCLQFELSSTVRFDPNNLNIF